MNGLIERERRLKKIKRNEVNLSKNLSVDFNREMTLAETCVYHDDFDGALYHGFVTDMIHRTLHDLEQSMNEKRDELSNPDINSVRKDIESAK